jgi:hypothetical protein
MRPGNRSLARSLVVLVGIGPMWHWAGRQAEAGPVRLLTPGNPPGPLLGHAAARLAGQAGRA